MQGLKKNRSGVCCKCGRRNGLGLPQGWMANMLGLCCRDGRLVRVEFVAREKKKKGEKGEQG